MAPAKAERRSATGCGVTCSRSQGRGGRGAHRPHTLLRGIPPSQVPSPGKLPPATAVFILTVRNEMTRRCAEASPRSVLNQHRCISHCIGCPLRYSLCRVCSSHPPMPPNMALQLTRLRRRQPGRESATPGAAAPLSRSMEARRRAAELGRWTAKYTPLQIKKQA